MPDFKAENLDGRPPPPLTLRCPACRQIGTLDLVQGNGANNDIRMGVPGAFITVGHRRCPNRACRTYVWVAHDAGNVVMSYPVQRIDFDSTNVPAPVLEALEEAVTCHAHQCYVAAAIMVRKTLEMLCADRGATGANLKERVAALGTAVLMPKELLAGLDELRLLGNDAAHVESRVFDEVGREEVEVGLAVTKEVLKSVYQYEALLRRLQGLKASTSNSS